MEAFAIELVLQSGFGLLVLTVLAFVIGRGLRALPTAHDLRVVIAGLAVQGVLALLLLQLPFVRDALLLLNAVVTTLQQATEVGAGFVFGYLGGGPLPFEETQPGASFILAFRALPLILVMSALAALLFHWRILPLLVRGFAWVLQRSLGVDGPLGVIAAANVFVGMVEAPLLVRPYIARLSRADLFAAMVVGMATIAGTMLVLYASVLGGVIDGALGQLLVASVLSAPAALMVARLMVPETDPGTADRTPARTPAKLDMPRDQGSMDAIVRGTLDGVGLLLNVVAMLLVFVALVALANAVLGLAPEVAGAPLTLQRMLGWLFAPLAWLIGIPWEEALTAGSLLGTKVILNEFVAYLDMAALDPEALSPRSRLLLTYAMCGFANLGSLGIMIGGLATLAPERRAEIVALGWRSIPAGLIATCMTGAVVGIVG